MGSKYKELNQLLLLTLYGIIFSTQFVDVEGKHVRSKYCKDQMLLKQGKRILDEEHNVTRNRVCAEFNDGNLNFFFSLFIMITLGAMVRTFLRVTKLSIPYTVVLMIVGLMLGLGSRINLKLLPWHEEYYRGKDHEDIPLTFCSFWSVYTKIARMPPKIILYAFLPVLVFDSAFNMKVHVFMRSAWQILIVALPGMVISTFLTATICLRLMSSYGWNFSQASLFGSIISATDPVAVVAILRELGASDTLGTMIEGESLLNDGVAILLFEIFEDIVKDPNAASSQIVKEVGTKFALISFGGPALGFGMAKLSVFCLKLIFNDAAVEITITLVAAYLTYYLGELFGVSGVVAVVVLGIVMNKDSTCITPEVESLVHHFWEMLGYLANTVLFVLVGIVITETAINQIERKDWFHLIFFYLALNIVRFVMLGLLMPWLCRVGYGLKWKDMVVIVWGGLRGAVGLCLSLQVYREPKLCQIGTENKKDILGPKFLFHTAGIVILTLIVNGTTTKGLLSALKLTEISPGKRQDMAQAVKGITGAQMRALNSIREDSFMSDCNWELVQQYTNMHDPYEKTKKQPKSNELTAPTPSEASLEPDMNRGRQKSTASAGTGTTADGDLPNLDDYRNLMEESRMKMLEALKVSFYRQFEDGLLTELAYHILVGVVNNTADKELHMIHSRDFKKYWHIHGIFPWIRLNVIKKLGLDSPPELPAKPSLKCRQHIWWLTTAKWFDPVLHLIVLLNLIPVIWETVLDIKGTKTLLERDVFFYMNCAFLAVYLAEFILKVVGHGIKYYFSVKWNYLDLSVLIVSIADIILSLVEPPGPTGPKASPLKIVVLSFRVGRVTRSLRLLRPLFPRFYHFIDGKIHDELFLGYDVGRGFVNAISDVLRYLPQMAENPKVFHKLKLALEHERLETVLAIGKLHFVHVSTAIGVKTRHACRSVLNAMRDQLSELKEDGLVDENESTVLLTLLEEKMKNLWKTPTSLTPMTPDELLGNVTWILGNSDLADYITNKATVVEFEKGELLCAEGDRGKGIYLIVRGIVKCHYRPTAQIIENLQNYGIVPNMEAYFDISFESEEVDFLTTGAIIGELGVVSSGVVSAQIVCATNVKALHINHENMLQAMTRFNSKIDSLEGRIWRSYGMRISCALFPTQPAYQFWNVDKIRTFLERSVVPVGEHFKELTIPEFSKESIVIYGRVMDVETLEVFTAPVFLPKSCARIGPVEGSPVDGRVLLIAGEEIEHETGGGGSLTTFHPDILNFKAPED